MTPLTLIGLTGFARTGKDTVGKIFINKGYERYAFADPLKKACVEMFGIPLADFHDNDIKETTNKFWGFSPRVMAQLLGTEGSRNVFRQDIWIKRAEIEWVKYQQYAVGENITFGENYMKGMVITDARFENEADFIRKHGLLIHITRPGKTGNVGINSHTSEKGIEFKPGDIFIENVGTLEDLEYKVNNVIQHMSL